MIGTGVGAVREGWRGWWLITAEYAAAALAGAGPLVLKDRDGRFCDGPVRPMAGKRRISERQLARHFGVLAVVLAERECALLGGAATEIFAVVRQVPPPRLQLILQQGLGPACEIVEYAPLRLASLWFRWALAAAGRL